ncbi:MAG: hypothetical protein CVV25_06760 [Ignavibacteriae bacterium HGW-Ignavibacteriae-4]|jgi:hypothetical protein|nr:MAG: hypothetical protein CVV25_06760 [Ignavibacteriae bacterium HGW-Ignavibacteriae-4]
MSKFFLNNNSINSVTNYNEFKEGLLELIAVNKQPSHIFYKHESIYALKILVDGLYTVQQGKDEQEIYRFLEHLSPCDKLVETEDEANTYCASTINGFFGINFKDSNIIPSKQLTDNDDYKKWCFAFLDNNDFFLSKTTIPIIDKNIHLSDHHGKKELDNFCNKIKISPYVEEMKSTDWGGKKFIRKVEANGWIELVLYKTDRQYALKVKTTGKDQLETEAISEILRKKYYI